MANGYVTIVLSRSRFDPRWWRWDLHHSLSNTPRNVIKLLEKFHHSCMLMKRMTLQDLSKPESILENLYTFTMLGENKYGSNLIKSNLLAFGEQPTERWHCLCFL